MELVQRSYSDYVAGKYAMAHSAARWSWNRRIKMRLKETMVVELTDVNTSEVETITEEIW